MTFLKHNVILNAKIKHEMLKTLIIKKMRATEINLLKADQL